MPSDLSQPFQGLGMTHIPRPAMSWECIPRLSNGYRPHREVLDDTYTEYRSNCVANRIDRTE
eukprot:12245066-Alexandrium_andersonii.AAC.1